MSVREVVALGTASQVPTRARSHHALLVRLDEGDVLVDPGEGTQRQLTLAGLSVSRLSAICLTHLHGDHCLGLPGVVQRLSLDEVPHPVDLWYPAEGEPYVRRLLEASVFESHAEVRTHPVDPDVDGAVGEVAGWRLVTHRLDHRIPCRGWRLEEPDGRRFDPARLAAAGVEGPDVSALEADGRLDLGGRVVTLDEVSRRRPGQVVAVVMDTRDGPGARALAEGADLAVIESTFLSTHDEEELALVSGHLTARQAATIAREAGVRRLVLTHFSQRHADVSEHLAEAAEIHADVHAAVDLDRVRLPSRR